MEPFDVMVLAPHPDDAEMACGGVLLQLVASRRVCIVDMTRGEMGTLGDAATRTRESEAATKMLGIQHRRNLELPDAMLRDDETSLAAVVGAIRELRPRILLAPHWQDVHPDHRAGAEIARRAFFHAGLRRYQPDTTPRFRPDLLAHYPGNDAILPSFCVDISAQAERKRRVIECYASQVKGGTSHMARRLGYLERVEARDRYFGSLIGCAAAEPFFVEGPLKVRGLASLLES